MGLFLCFFLLGHGVEATFEEVKGVEVNVRYADGSPMAFAEVRVIAPSGKEIKGETDDNGKFLFYPGEKGKWRIEIDDGLGHGIVKEMEYTGEMRTDCGKKGLSQYEKALTGVGIILGIFGFLSYILQLVERRRAHS